MELATTAVGILLLLVVWRAWRKTMLDASRDALFDLRDRSREWFLANGYGLDHRLYRELRDVLNAQLRFTENMRFVGLLYFAWRMPATVIAQMNTDIQTRFDTSDETLRRYVTETRRQAIRALQTYMILTSTTVMILILALTPVVAVSVAWKGLTGLAQNTRKALVRLIDQTVIRPNSVELAAVLNDQFVHKPA